MPFDGSTLSTATTGVFAGNAFSVIPKMVRPQPRSFRRLSENSASGWLYAFDGIVGAHAAILGKTKDAAHYLYARSPKSLSMTG